MFARPSRALSPVATVPELLLSCVILGKFYLALFVELANRIFSQFIKTWSKLAKSRGKSFTILFQSQINLWNKENFNQINLQNFAAAVEKNKVVITTNCFHNFIPNILSQNPILIEFCVRWEPSGSIIPHLAARTPAPHWLRGTFIIFNSLRLADDRGWLSSKIHQSVTLLVTPSPHNNIN